MRKILLNPLSKITQLFSSSVILSVAMTFAISSCKTGNTVSPDNIQVKKISIADYTIIGVQHNRGLDSMYNVLRTVKENNQINFTNKQSIFEFVKTSLLNDLERKAVDLKARNAINSVMSNQINLLAAKKSVQINSTSTSKSIALYSDSLAAHLSVNQKATLDKLGTIMLNESLNVSQAIAEIGKLEVSAKNNLTDKELPLIYVSTSIAKSTMQYWNDNFDKWITLLNSKNTNDTRLSTQALKTLAVDWSWRNFGASDVAGGAGAAATTWVLNIEPGGGQIAYGSAIVGGAVGGSVYYAVYKLLSD